LVTWSVVGKWHESWKFFIIHRVRPSNMLTQGILLIFQKNNRQLSH